MARLFAACLIVHGAIHLLGTAKAFRWADLPALTQPISHAMGLVWLAGAVLFVSAAFSIFLWPRWWWAVAAVAILCSMVAIVHSWADARPGALANGVVLVGAMFGFLTFGPSSLRAQYDHDVDQALMHGTAGPVVTDADLATLPTMVQRYLRRVGVVGQPRASNARATVSGRIRSGPDAAWMPFSAEQYNVVVPATRLFYMTASSHALPLQGYHRYVGSEATMRIRAAALVPVLDVQGPEMNQSETVTVLNDLCLLMPPLLVDAPIQWEPIDPHSVRATFSNAGQTVQGVLSFNDDGELVDFWSDDRYQSAPDGKTMAKVRWSTPVSRYRQFGAFRLPAVADARWHDATGAWVYIELTIDDVQFNVGRPLERVVN
jgi:hypothetical protein